MKAKARSKVSSNHPARYRPVALLTELLSVFVDEQLFPAAAMDWFAAFPEAPRDSVLAKGRRESAPVRAVSSDRQARVSVAAFAVVFVPMQRSRPLILQTPEPPILLTE